MRFGSLFAGIGGIDLGLERAGMQCAWQVEIDPFCQRVLAKHWPDVPRFADVRDVGAHNLEPVDLIAGGFPCQDISDAGKRAGIDAGERSGLWREFARLIGELRPRYALVENVSALLERGLGRVLGDLADLGYDAEWDCLSAAEFGAPHLRERIFVLANNRQAGGEGVISGEVRRIAEFSWCQDVRGPADLRGRPDLPTPVFRGTRDGIPNWVDRVGACGNAVVPGIAEWIGRRIIEWEARMTT